MTQRAVAERVLAAARVAARRTGLEAHLPPLLVRFGFPGLFARLGLIAPVDDAAHQRLQRLHHVLLRERAVDIASALTHAGIQHLFAKGVALLGPVYEPGDRLIADIDLYVRPSDREAAVRVLETLGFAAAPEREQVGPASMRATLALARSGRDDVDHALVDLHWALDPVDRLLPRPDGPMPDGLWTGAREEAGLTVPDPDRHAALLAHHLVHSDLLHVRSLVDLAMLVGPDGRIGTGFHATCAALGIARFGTGIAAFLVREFDGDRIADGTPSPPVRSLAAWLTMVARTPVDDDPAMTLARARRRARLVDRGAWRLVQDALWPPAAFLRWRWPALSAGRARARHLARLTRKLLLAR